MEDEWATNLNNLKNKRKNNSSYFITHWERSSDRRYRVLYAFLSVHYNN